MQTRSSMKKATSSLRSMVCSERLLVLVQLPVTTLACCVSPTWDEIYYTFFESYFQ